MSKNEKMTTIKELADELGMTKQGIWRHVNKLPPNFTVKSDDGKILINGAATEFIREEILKGRQQRIDTHVDTLESKVIDILQTTIAQLEKQLEMKDAQLAEKDQQISQLQKAQADITLALLQEQDSAKAAQHLHAGSIQKLLDEGKPRKKGFFERFKKDDE